MREWKKEQMYDRWGAIGMKDEKATKQCWKLEKHQEHGNYTPSALTGLYTPQSKSQWENLFLYRWKDFHLKGGIPVVDQKWNVSYNELVRIVVPNSWLTFLHRRQNNTDFFQRCSSMVNVFHRKKLNEPNKRLLVFSRSTFFKSMTKI